ncbi:MAG: hypothetical protein M3016_10170 [Actinomycetota bacterium]|nr:hypothetical protein [Actinomycetota bacterium]
MSAGHQGPLRLVCFGDADGQVWGSAIDAGEPAIVICTPAGSACAAGARVQIRDQADGWEVSGAGIELVVTPTAPTGEPAIERGGAELCQVRGTVTADGTGREVSCAGMRSSDPQADLGRLGSLRALSGWFDDEHALALCALRPSGATDHEHDMLTATVFDPGERIAVVEPRLSTTFGPGEQPVRASLELWIGDEEEQYPRRAAAEAVAPPASIQSERVRLSVTPLRCHSGGRDGAGVYLIAHI